jgi:hypothetical protein
VHSFMTTRAELRSHGCSKIVGCPAPGHRAKISVSSFPRGCSIGPKSSAKGSCYSPRNPAQSSMAIRAGLTERRSFKDRCMWGPGNWSTKKVQERSFRRKCCERKLLLTPSPCTEFHGDPSRIDGAAFVQRLFHVTPPDIERKFQLVLFPEKYSDRDEK